MDNKTWRKKIHKKINDKYPNFNDKYPNFDVKIGQKSLGARFVIRRFGTSISLVCVLKIYYEVLDLPKFSDKIHLCTRLSLVRKYERIKSKSFV